MDNDILINQARQLYVGYFIKLSHLLGNLDL